MSSAVNEHLPKLHHAKFEKAGNVDITVNYKSGASFVGKVENHMKCGKGVFKWPNGAKYDGEYADNVRKGRGIQTWQDGSHYEGHFFNDMRHGEGQVVWANGESYKGTFYKDRRHGRGVYTWPDGSSYTGTFYMDRKEGYASFKFANGNIFEGLYKDDEREGPGILTYENGTQDVGLWHGEKLIKFCTPIPDAFTMKNHKEFDFNPEEHIEYISMEETKPLSNQEKVTSPDIFDYLPDSQVTEKVTDLYNEMLDPRSLAVNKEEFDREFFKDYESEKSDKDEKFAALNRTPSMKDIQRHIYKHKQNQKTVGFDVQLILNGDRSKFKVKGPLEIASEDLITAATTGDSKKVEDLLTIGKVHPDVADVNGHTALIAATVNWHIDVINILLNNGANVNKLNDEGCSALSAGTIFFYPIDGFRYNIAERYLERPASVAEKDRKAAPSRSKGVQSRNKSKTPSKTPKPKPLTDDEKKPKPDVSSTSIDSGFPQNESSVSVVTPGGKPSVRIMEPKQSVEGSTSKDNQDSAVWENKDRTEEMEFESTATLRDFQIEVSDQLIERCATQLSTNEKIVGGRRSHNSANLGTVRHLAVMKNEKERMKATLDLLVSRGANPNASGVPMPVLFFAIKSADVEVVKTLLMKGASTAITLPKEKGGLAPLHIASAIPGEEGVQITELLLNALADPDVRATEDDSFLNRNLEEEWSKDQIAPESQDLLGGRSPLHIACARDDNYKNACRVVHLLLEHKANPDLLCNGFSALALAIASGNDYAIDELLHYGCDPSLPLTHGVGSALCASTSTEYEYRRKNVQQRLHLIDKLIKAGANILAPIPIGPKRIIGTAVDYTYYIYSQDHRIAHMPFHALSHSERGTYEDRKKVLKHIGDILRTKAVEREKTRMEEELSSGRRSRSPSPGFVYIGAGAPIPSSAKLPKALRGIELQNTESKVTFESGTKDPQMYGRGYPEREPAPLPTRKPLFKYCYECGRSVNVRLSACTRCKEVYYCGKPCKMAAWKARHSEECIRVGGRSRSPSPSGFRKNRGESPTPATDIKGKKTTVTELNKGKQRINVPFRGKSKSAKGGRDINDNDGRRVMSEKFCRHWSPPPGVKVDNYSFV
ncbi:hypothetical protein FSP39_005371 [Pinctada imbricata]|uniref:MYND-type domain-containing protein n=1 Tax=Pinctada imbricata TaxID=66713 RepID=A0AA88Y862_PINIB|nr:hypothetical protein FSP39_005371 [Pinctada imbricata]